MPRYPVEPLAIGVNSLLRQFLTTSTSGMDGQKREIYPGYEPNLGVSKNQGYPKMDGL